MTTNKSSSKRAETALERFVSSLTSEERELAEAYLEKPDASTLAESFDAIVEKKS